MPIKEIIKGISKDLGVETRKKGVLRALILP